MAQTLRKRRLSPETQPADGAAPVPPACIAATFAEPPSPAHARVGLDRRHDGATSSPALPLEPRP